MGGGDGCGGVGVGALTTIRLQVTETGFEAVYPPLQNPLSIVWLLVCALALVTIRSHTRGASAGQSVNLVFDPMRLAFSSVPVNAKHFPTIV